MRKIAPLPTFAWLGPRVAGGKPSFPGGPDVTTHSGWTNRRSNQGVLCAGGDAAIRDNDDPVRGRCQVAVVSDYHHRAAVTRSFRIRSTLALAALSRFPAGSSARISSGS